MKFDALENQCKARFRRGTILAYQDNDEKLKIKLHTGATPEEPDFENVEVHYHCQPSYPTVHPTKVTEVFLLGDEVLVEVDNQEEPVAIVGFPAEPRACVTTGICKLTQKPVETGVYDVVYFQIWINSQQCTVSGSEDTLFNIRTDLREIYSDNAGHWIITDFRFAKDYPFEIVFLVERRFTPQQRLNTPTASEYRESRVDLYTAIVYRINQDLEMTRDSVYTVPPGTRKCIGGGCAEQYDSDFQSSKDCPSVVNKCGQESSCQGQTEVSQNSSCGGERYGWTNHGVNEYNWSIAGECDRTCSRGCGSVCCYNCYLGMKITKIFHERGGIPYLFGEQTTTTNVLINQTSVETEINNNIRTETHFAGPDAPGCSEIITRNTRSITGATYSPGNDSNCTACCSSTSAYSSIHQDTIWSSTIECCPFFWFGEPEKCGPRSGSYVSIDHDSGSVLLPGRGRVGCMDTQFHVATRLVVGNYSNYNCSNFASIAMLHQKVKGEVEYAYGTLKNTVTANIWGYDCSCGGGSDDADYCNITYGNAGDFSWSADLLFYNILDLDKYFWWSYESYRCYDCGSADIEQSSIMLIGSDFTLPNELPPLYALPQSSLLGMSFIGHKIHLTDNRFKSYTTAYNGSLDDLPMRVRCKNGLACSDSSSLDVLTNGEFEYSLLIHSNRAGFVFQRAFDSESILGTWHIKSYSYIALDSMEGEIGVVNFDFENPIKDVLVENTPFVIKEDFTTCVQGSET